MTIFHYSPHMECVSVLRIGYRSRGRYRLHPYVRLITMHFFGTVQIEPAFGPHYRKVPTNKDLNFFIFG